MTWHNLNISTSINKFFSHTKSRTLDEDVWLHENVSYIIISHTKIIFIKHFYIPKRLKSKRVGK